MSIREDCETSGYTEVHNVQETADSGMLSNSNRHYGMIAFAETNII